MFKSDSLVNRIPQAVSFVNAAQAIEKEGVIRIKTFSDGTYAYVKITDTGKGIPPENLAKIFDPGFTTKGVRVGTGLGLSTSYNIMQKHEGEIGVESQVGKEPNSRSSCRFNLS